MEERLKRIPNYSKPTLLSTVLVTMDKGVNWKNRPLESVDFSCTIKRTNLETNQQQNIPPVRRQKVVQTILRVKFLHRSSRQPTDKLQIKNNLQLVIHGQQSHFLHVKAEEVLLHRWQNNEIHHRHCQHHFDWLKRGININPQTTKTRRLELGIKPSRPPIQQIQTIPGRSLHIVS